MCTLDLATLNASEFSQYANADPPIVADPPIIADGKFIIGMELSYREIMIAAIKDYTIRREVDYQVYESEPTTFYAKCIQYENNCDWHIRASLIQKKYCWEIKRYNGSHTYYFSGPLQTRLRHNRRSDKTTSKC
nr:uncharacterized protein LOC112801500 [Arachis hypogaea]